MRNFNLIKRLSKGAALTWPEMDGNWKTIEQELKGLSIPAAPGLSASDIGKILVLKNGQAQLPSFDSVPVGANQLLSFSFLSSFVPYTLPRLEITFLQNLVPNDFVEVTLRTFLNTPISITLTAVASDDNESSFLIGANEAITMENYAQKLEARMSFYGIHPCYTVQRTDPTSNSIAIVAQVLEFDRQWSFWENTGTSNLYISINRIGDNYQDRIGSAPLAEVAVKGIRYNINGTSFQYDTGGLVYSVLSQSPEHSLVLYMMTSNDTTVRLPLNVSEFMNGIGHAIATIFQGYVSHSINNQSIEIELDPQADNIFINLFNDENIQYFNNFSDLTIEDGTPFFMTICTDPIIGQLAAFENNQAVISADPIGRFQLKGNQPIVMSQEIPLISLGRFCCLDPDHPGYLKVVEMTNQYALLTIAPGFVVALEEKQPEEFFLGELTKNVLIFAILFGIGE
jgi:hypothetical protein